MPWSPAHLQSICRTHPNTRVPRLLTAPPTCTIRWINLVVLVSLVVAFRFIGIVALSRRAASY